jgi:hypothetical protein
VVEELFSMSQARLKEQTSKQPLSAVHTLLSLLLSARNMFSLYAEDHAHCQKALARLHRELDRFLEKHEALALEVKEDQLLYVGEVVHKGPAKDGELAFTLFRDGIVSLAFLQGLEIEELDVFIRILARYRLLPSAAEGDIVTALWEAEMLHIEYQAIDNILEADGKRESLSKDGQNLLQSLPPAVQESPDSLQRATEELFSTAKNDISLPVLKAAPLPLTMEEASCIRDMVRTEEGRDATQEILNMLSGILNQDQSESAFSYVLDYLVEELSLCFGRKDFEVALKIFKTLKYVLKLCREAGPWAVSRIRRLLMRISGPDFLQCLKDGWATVSNVQLAQARDVLLFMPPVAILQLGVMVPAVPVSVRTMLLDVILRLAIRDIRPFQELLETSSENLLTFIVPLLGKIKGEKSDRLLLKMMLHTSEAIRKEALKAIILRRLWVPEALGPLLNDESDYIRRLAVRYLSSRKSVEGETILIEYLKRAKASKNNGAELIGCFKALGKCGTAVSIPFLQDTLLKGNWISRFRDSMRRRGAAIALASLDSEDTKAVLDKASRSRFAAVRNAAQSVYLTGGG